jgi:O-antigen ligase
MALSAANAAVSADRAWADVAAFAKIALPFLIGATLIDSTAKLKQIAWVLTLSQSYVAYEMNLSYYSGFNRVSQGQFGGLDNNAISIAMVCGAGLAFFLGVSERVGWRRWLCFFGATLMVHVPMFGMSRGGQLALVVLAAVSFYLLPKRPQSYALFALAVAVGLMLAGPSVRARFATVFVDAEQRDKSASSRLELWADCWDVMKHHPSLGVGPGHWQLIAHRYGWPRGKAAHSVWFETGADLGFPGLGLFVGFFGCTVWSQWKLLRRPPPEPWLADAARMTIAALVGYAAAATFVTLEELELPYYVALLGAGALRLAPDDDRDENTSRRLAGGQRPADALSGGR